MKTWIRSALVASIFASSHAYAAENGVNYDPAHSGAYVGENFDSYYFSAYDKISGGGCPNDDADRHFGLCSESGLTKDVRLMKCK